MLSALAVALISGQSFPTTIPSVLVISGVSAGGRTPFPADAIQKQIAAGTWSAPHEGDKVTGQSGTKAWEPISANKEGWFEGDALANAYVYCQVESAKSQVLELVAQGDSMAYINGEPHAGDPYQFGYSRMPFKANAGNNQILMPCSRGRLKVEVISPPKPIHWNLSDITLPDFIAADKGYLWGSAVVVNATESWLPPCTISANGVQTISGRIPPLSLRKVNFKIPTGYSSNVELVPVELAISRNEVLDKQTVKIRCRKPGQVYRRTFLSQVDRSVQYYAVNPGSSKAKALIMTLHGASVEGQGQAEAYASKPWCNIVAPTNRRPYGFDWEEVGRLDFEEVLAEAANQFHPDPDRVYLTGHSMGGHGTWQIGAQFPDKFAAIAPSAGWISFFSYAGGVHITGSGSASEAMGRAANPSDTLLLKNNYLSYPIYILHGDADDNVPVTEARHMRETLSAFHPHVEYHEEPGAGHWWGNQCVDWKPIFDLFASTKRISDSHLDFTTCNPAISSRYRWATVLQQTKPLAPSHLVADRTAAKITIRTDNIELLKLDLKPWDTRAIEIDDDRLQGSGSVVLRKGTHWTVSKVRSGEKSPSSSGPFKNVFRNHFALIYGTSGSPEQNSWMQRKAIFDAEQFWYRGNGSVDIFSDAEFLKHPDLNRNMVVYGNATANRAWAKFLKDCPIQVRGPGRSLLCIRPLRSALIAAIGGSDLAGMRNTERLPYFTSGVQYPDWITFDSSIFDKGIDGNIEAGFFDNNWRMQGR